TMDISSTVSGDIVLTETNDVTLTGVDTASGSITIIANDMMTVNATGVSAGGSGNVLLQTLGGSTVHLVLNAAVSSTTGSIKINAAGDIHQNANVTATSGYLDLESTAGGIIVAATFKGETTSGHILYQPATTIDVLGTID